MPTSNQRKDIKDKPEMDGKNLLFLRGVDVAKVIDEYMLGKYANVSLHSSGEKSNSYPLIDSGTHSFSSGTTKEKRLVTTNHQICVILNSGKSVRSEQRCHWCRQIYVIDTNKARRRCMSKMPYIGTRTKECR